MSTDIYPLYTQHFSWNERIFRMTSPPARSLYLISFLHIKAMLHTMRVMGLRETFSLQEVVRWEHAGSSYVS